MPRSVECFWIEPSDTAEESLRRYVSKSGLTCPLPHGYHDAKLALGVVPWQPREDHKELYGTYAEPPLERTDPRWPTVCACGYVFAPTDEWQHHLDRQMVRKDTGARFALRQAPPGAMWDAKWWNQPHPTDGICLCVKLPDGVDWMVDGPATNGPKGQPGWARTGAVPKITARPSILTSGYHGFLTDGILVD